MIRDQIHSTISLYQHNVLRHSFMDKLKEESVSFCGDSFIPRAVGIGIVAMGCLPIELPPFWWRDSFRPVSQVYQDRHRGFYSARWTRRLRCLCCYDWYQSIKREVSITCWQQGVSSSQAITQIVRALSSVPKRK